PFDGTNSPRNLLTKLRGYKRVLDAKNSITYMPDFFEALRTLVAKRATGIYNVVNPRAVSPYDIMVRYKNEVDPSHEFERISVEELSQIVVAGRSNCELDVSKLEKEGIVMRPSSDAISEAFASLRKT
nr:hypothetical protein [Candidatus Peribacteraceae bacterium]